MASKSREGEYELPVMTQRATVQRVVSDGTAEVLRYATRSTTRRHRRREPVVGLWAWGLSEPIDVAGVLGWNVDRELAIVAKGLAQRLAAVWKEGKTVKVNEAAMEFDVVYPFRFAQADYQAVLRPNPDGSGTVEIYEVAPDG